MVKSPVEVRFWKFVNKNGPVMYSKMTPCWLWTGARQGGPRARDYGGKFNYGVIMTSLVDGKRKLLLAHRVSWEIAFGIIPNQLSVLHRCDNAICVNPEHLFLGTRRTNADDKVAKNRQARGTALSRLSEDQVRQIRSLAERRTQRQLAKEFGVAQQTISQIVRRSIWKYLL